LSQSPKAENVSFRACRHPTCTGLPGDRQSPWSPQSDLHIGFLQSIPPHPSKQSQTPGTEHLPAPEHPLRADRASEAVLESDNQIDHSYAVHALCVARKWEATLANHLVLFTWGTWEMSTGSLPTQPVNSSKDFRRQCQSQHASNIVANDGNLCFKHPNEQVHSFLFVFALVAGVCLPDRHTRSRAVAVCLSRPGGGGSQAPCCSSAS